MFKGDLAQFAPADLLLFLCHMNKVGVLTVRGGDEVLHLSFQRHLLVEAHCEAADRLVLAHLSRAGAATDEAVARLRQAQEETGLPLSRVLTEMAALVPAGAGEALAAGRRDTVMRLLLLDGGEFQFNEIAVDTVPSLTPREGQGLVMDLTREVDEYREALRGLGALERRPVRTAAGTSALADSGAVATLTAEWEVLELAAAADSVAALLATLPLPRLEAARAILGAVEHGWLALTDRTPDAATHADRAIDPGFFCLYRRALRRLLQIEDGQHRIRELLQFAQAHCKVSVLLVAQAGILRRATVYYRDPGGRLAARDHREPPVDLAGDPVFQQALQGGLPFVGAVFPSPLLDALEADAPAADCAVLPLGSLGGHEILLYAATAEPSPAVGPLSCLELLSWQIQRPACEGRLHASAAAGDTAGAPATGEAPDGVEGCAKGPDLDRMVAAIKDLPPMPQVLVRTLELLGNPDCKMAELSTAMSMDPALVARLIKVSNSSLYSGGQPCGSLNQAIVRLGTRTIRSLVVAASTRSLFPTDGSRIGTLGRRLWRHAVETGMAARRVAEFLRRGDPDEAFAAGVLHDLGKLIILLNLPDEALAIDEERQRRGEDSVHSERRRLGFDHTEVGDCLLQHWRLPGALAACARWHHEPAAAGEWTDLARVVACGNLMSHALGAASGPDDRRDQRLSDAAAAVGLDDVARADLLDLLALDLQQGDLLD